MTRGILTTIAATAAAKTRSMNRSAEPRFSPICLSAQGNAMNAADLAPAVLEMAQAHRLGGRPCSAFHFLMLPAPISPLARPSPHP